MGRGFLLARFLYIFQHWQRRAKQFGCLMRGKGGKLLIIHARVAIRIVGNTAHRCVFGSIDIAHLRNTSALHLTGNRPKGGGDPMKFFCTADKLVPGGDPPNVDVSLVRAASRSLGKHPIHFRGGGDDNQVDSGYHANLVADLGGIHIVLNGTVR